MIMKIDYLRAMEVNRIRFAEGDAKASSEYIYPNQKADAEAIVRAFEEGRHVVSISKRTKVGMDGLMIQIAYLMATHKDDSLAVLPTQIRILTGMSNVAWEQELKSKVPQCLENQIFHHGKLHRSKLKTLQDALIIVDEVDTGDKQYQHLYTTLQEAGIMDVAKMRERNIRFVFTSATLLRELYDLDKWGDLHYHYRMTVPPNYIGHKEFLERDIIRDFYPLTTIAEAERWIKEDILDRYGTEDKRVHLVRLKVDKSNASLIKTACNRASIVFREHNSENRIPEDELKALFEGPLQSHVVLGIKGFFRRANLIPNLWKMRIGATHECCTQRVDNNVQVQGLCGRMSGYWRQTLDEGHLTGPYRTSVQAIQEYEDTYEDPFGPNSYKTAGFRKRKGKVRTSIPTIVSAQFIKGLNELMQAKLQQIHTLEQ